MTGGTRGFDPGPPPLVRRSMYKKKVAHDQGLSQHTAATICNEVLDPPPPKGVPRYGGGGGAGGQNRKNHWGINSSPKMMVLQGVRHPIPSLGVCYANDPKRGGGGAIWHPCLRLISQPSPQ